MAAVLDESKPTDAFQAFNTLCGALEASYRDGKTPLARLERLGKERRAMLGEMAACLAHDVRTPLTAALLYPPRLGLDGASDDDRREIAARLLARPRHRDGPVADRLALGRGGDRRQRRTRAARTRVRHRPYSAARATRARRPGQGALGVVVP